MPALLAAPDELECVTDRRGRRRWLSSGRSAAMADEPAVIVCIDDEAIPGAGQPVTRP
jgi:hypothetical protein